MNVGLVENQTDERLDACRLPSVTPWQAIRPCLRQDAVEGGVAIVDPVLDRSNPLFTYECGSLGPPEARRLVGGGWG